MMKNIVKIALVLLAICLMVTCFVACKDKKPVSYVAKINGDNVADGIFMAMFNEVLDELYKDEDTGLDYTLEGEKFFKQLKEKKTESGELYIDYFINEALSRAKLMIVAKQMAVKDNKWATSEELKSSEEEAKSELEYYLSYYQYYGYSFSSINQLAGMMYGMTADDYMEYFAFTSALNKFQDELGKTVEFTEEDLKKFYEENVDLYRIVTVRHSLLKTEGLDETKKAEVLAKAEEYIEKYNNGEMTMDEIVAKSDDSKDGYYDVVANGQFVPEFQQWAVSRKEVSDDLEIVETTYGYHIMQCTGIKTFDDETVKAKVEIGYADDVVSKLIEEESKKEVYEIKDVNKSYAEKIILRSLVGDFEGEDDDKSATQAPSATPVEYNDAAADTTVVAKLGDIIITKPYYREFFSQAISTILLPDLEIPEDMELEQQYEYLIEQMKKEYKDGKTYSQATHDKAVELLLKFMVTKKIAMESEHALTEEKIASYEAELDSQIDQMLSYYGSYYEVSTRDEFMNIYVGMNVEDYKKIYIDQIQVNDYSEAIIKDITASDDEIAEYYVQHEEELKIITVRRILRSTVDSNGKEYTDEQKAEVYKIVEAIIAKIDDGDSLAALAKAWSQDSGVDTDEGLADIVKAYSDFDDQINQWIYSQTEIGSKKVFETKEGYEIFVIEGITTITEQKGIAADDENVSCEAVKTQITNAIKAEKFDKKIDDYIKENNLSLTDINKDVTSAVEKEFLTYKE